MNFLFGALLLIILLLPGVVLRVSYLSTPYGKKTFRFSLADELILSLIPTLLLQGIAYMLTNYLIFDIDEKKLFYFLTNNEKAFDEPFAESGIALFLTYTVALCFFSALAGVYLRKLVQRHKLDIRYPILRFYNDWHYIFRGMILDFPGHEGRTEDIDNVWVDVVVENNNEAYIYSGLLMEYVLTKDDGLDRIYLTNVQRRKLSEDRRKPLESSFSEQSGRDKLDKLSREMIDYDGGIDESSTQVHQLEEHMDSRYYYMPGDYFVIPYNEIRNINITYYKEVITEEQEQ